MTQPPQGDNHVPSHEPDEVRGTSEPHVPAQHGATEQPVVTESVVTEHRGATEPHREIPKRKGVGMIVLGALLMSILAPLALAAGLAMGVKDVQGTVSMGTVGVEETVDLPANAKFEVKGKDAYRESGADAAATPECKVTGPDGDIPFSLDSEATKLDDGEYDLGSFTTQKQGMYHVVCAPYTKVDFIDETATDAAETTFKNSMLPAAIASAVLGLLGLTLLILGILKRIRTGKAAKAAEQAQAGYGTRV